MDTAHAEINHHHASHIPARRTGPRPKTTLLFRGNSGRCLHVVLKVDADSFGDGGSVIDSLVVRKKTALLAEQETALAATAELLDVRLAQPGADRFRNLLRLVCVCVCVCV